MLPSRLTRPMLLAASGWVPTIKRQILTLRGPITCALTSLPRGRHLAMSRKADSNEDEEMTDRSRFFYAFQSRLAGPAGKELPSNVFLVLHELMANPPNDSGDQPLATPNIDGLTGDQLFTLGNMLMTMRGDVSLANMAGKTAASAYQRAALKNDANAQYAYARLQLTGGYGVAKDVARAFSFLEPLAKAGHPHAQCTLGIMYLNGEVGDKGSQSNFDKARSLFEVAAANGQAIALTMIGHMHAQGQGAPINMDKAVLFYNQAVAKGDPVAHLSLAQCHGKGLGVPLSAQHSFEHHMAAAEAGLPVALYNVANHYLTGEGVEQNFGKAAQFFEKAAVKGFPYAQINLGSLYREGRGVPQDTAKAIGWYKQAAATVPEARELLAELEASQNS